jgi:hypothetical protein
MCLCLSFDRYTWLHKETANISNTCMHLCSYMVHVCTYRHISPCSLSCEGLEILTPQ